MERKLSKTVAIAVLFLAAVVWKLAFNRRRTPKAPGIGYGRLPVLGTWQGVIAFFRDPEGIIARGYAQYKDSYFRVSTNSMEYVLVSDEKKIAEYLAAPEEVLSFQDWVTQLLQAEWTMGYGVTHQTYHIPVARTKLTQSIASNVPAMTTEIQEAMQSLVGSPERWTQVKLYDVMVRIVARVSNTAFSGRNETYLDNAIAYAQSVLVSAELIRLFPKWLKPFIAWFTPIRKMQKQAVELMGAVVQKRLDTTWADGERPKDMLQFLVDSAPDAYRTMPRIVETLMMFNMASIHTTTAAITTAIYALAAEPEKYIPALRAELLEHCIDGRIDKETLRKLSKLDSFLRECGRVQTVGNIGLIRFARKDFTFSDGMVVPAGCAVGAPILPLQNETSILSDPHVFDGFRYSRMNEESPGPTKYEMVNTSLNYLFFGYGKHACPGRFLAVAEMKLILAIMLLQYDIKLIPGTRPKGMWFGTAFVPELKLPILIKTTAIKDVA